MDRGSLLGFWKRTYCSRAHFWDLFLSSPQGHSQDLCVNPGKQPESANDCVGPQQAAHPGQPWRGRNYPRVFAQRTRTYFPQNENTCTGVLGIAKITAWLIQSRVTHRICRRKISKTSLWRGEHSEQGGKSLSRHISMHMQLMQMAWPRSLTCLLSNMVKSYCDHLSMLICTHSHSSS